MSKYAMKSRAKPADYQPNLKSPLLNLKTDMELYALLISLFFTTDKLL